MNTVNQTQAYSSIAWRFIAVLFLSFSYACIEDITPVPEPEPEPDPIELHPLEIGGRLEQDSTLTNWREGVDYIVTGNINIWADVILDIEPGVVIEVKNGLAIRIKDQGAIRARGTEAEPIIFRGHETGGVPNWKAITVSGTNTNTIFDYVIVEDAGTEAPCCDGFWPDAAFIIDGVGAITNCTFRKSGSIGLAISTSRFYANLLAFENNHFENNASYGLSIHPSGFNTAFSSGIQDCSFDGNGKEYVNVINGYFQGGLHTISQAPVPYHVSGWIISNNDQLEIKAGAELIFAQGAGIKSDILTITGTETNPVTMYGEAGVANSWEGLVFDSDNIFNKVIHLDISHAKSAIDIDYQASAEITNTHISDSECGFFTGLYATLTTDNITFTNVTTEYCE